MPTPRAVPRYNFRARYAGQLHWICPYSGHFNHTHIDPGEFRVVCVCKRRFAPGVVLYSTTRGSKSVPPDWVIPVGRGGYNSTVGLSELLPMGDLAITPWRKHQPTHVLMDPAGIDYDVRAFVHQTRLVAETLVPSDLAPSTRTGGSSGGLSKYELLSLNPIMRAGLAFEIVANAGGW